MGERRGRRIGSVVRDWVLSPTTPRAAASPHPAQMDGWMDVDGWTYIDADSLPVLVLRDDDPGCMAVDERMLRARPPGSGPFSRVHVKHRGICGAPTLRVRCCGLLRARCCCHK